MGELSRRAGVPVKTIRFYSDRGIVPPAGRSPAGCRPYDPDALARLELVRTLRELGLDLATIRRVLDRDAPLPEVMQAHAAEQVDAWVELVGLCQSADSCGALRRTARNQEEELSRRDAIALQESFDLAMRERIDEAVSADLLQATDTSSADLLAALYARAFEDAAEGDLRRWLLARLRTSADPLVERYRQLLATVNGWPPSSALAPVHSWFTGTAV
ncbi:MerR family transcriptional regulator [Streptomyces sp. NPDC048507]|uniref:helix-turn-helix domain-containing protein n=1 Tax=Streptomyces sp. NPDC048507 TaxID=3365560 RepID=UPI00371FA2C8